MSSTLDTLPPEHAALQAALHGQYAIQRELGRGGMGIVLLARDERLDRAVALKVLPPHLADIAETRERFLREARMAAQLSHPNIVPVYRADELGGFAFFAMGFVDGESLSDRIRDRGALPAPDVVRILREVAWALAYAHARGIVHRDVKPDNILLERSTGRAIVTDFGIARADFNPALTQDGYVLGTVQYMSPEQCRGEALDGRADLYALGCIGFLALSGRLPFEGTSPQALLIAHATREPPALGNVAPQVSAALASVVDRCLSKNPADRFATGEELADALGKALEHLEHTVRDVGGRSTLSSDDAMAVWRRAAELQAEAAARLEQRVRTNTAHAMTAPHAIQSNLPARQNGAGDVREVVPTDAYRLRDVEAAAVEAGISQRFVALALDELRQDPSGQALAPTASPRFDRFATRVMGTTQRTLSVSRRFRAPARTVLQALGRILQGHPWMLTLRDTLGGHPLDGGILVFDLPPMVTTDYKWSYTRYGVYVPQVRVSLATIPGDTRSCEVTMTIDLRHGTTGIVATCIAMASGGGVVGGIAGLAAGKGLLALSGAILVAPGLAGAAILAGLSMTSIAPLYRWGLRKAEAELAAALAAIDAGMRAFDIFGESPPPPPPRSSLGDGMGF